jgi:hypothetical protein
MDEIVPVILAALLGGLIWHNTAGLIRLLLSAVAVVTSGAAATILSGEFIKSWVYLLPDLVEALFGLTIGIAIVRRFLTPQRNAVKGESGHIVRVCAGLLHRARSWIILY